VLEEGGRRALIGAADLGTFPLDGSTREAETHVAAIVGCPVENVLFNASHSHGTPLVPMGDITFHGAVERRPGVQRYRDWLFEQIASAAAEAAENLREGTLWLAEGRTRLPMNRRPDRAGGVPNAPNPDGPTDARLLVFMVRDAHDTPVALGVRVSCHPVATGAQHRLTADFPGAWRRRVLDAFGNAVTPFFLQGVGADARPRHVAAGERWRQIPHDDLEIIGRELWAETLAALTGPHRRKLENLVLEGHCADVELPCESRYTRRADFEALLEQPRLAGYARQCLERLDLGKSVSDRPVFHVQTLWLDDRTTGWHEFTISLTCRYLIDEWLQGVQFCFDDELMLFVALLSQAGDVLLLVDDGQLLVVAFDARLQGFHLRVQGPRL